MSDFCDVFPWHQRSQWHRNGHFKATEEIFLKMNEFIFFNAMMNFLVMDS